VSKNYWEIVLTGGPCSGKTTAKSWLTQFFSERGFKVLTPPEVATMMFDSGLNLASQTEEVFQAAEVSVLGIQRSIKENFRRIAESHGDEPVIIFYDRAELDVRAYVDEQLWQQLLAEHNLTNTEIASSYDLVVHLTTAAIGAPDFYTVDNNAARTETADQAIEMDQKTLQAWLGSQNLKIVGNAETFEEKMEKLLGLVSQVVGVAEPLEVEKKFLLKRAPSSQQLAELGAVPIHVEQTYLLNTDPDSETRVRLWQEPSGERLFTWTTKTKVEGGRREDEALISKDEYNRMLAQADPDLQTVRKTRWCFGWQGQHCELDHFLDHDIWILEIELDDLSTQVDLPDFVFDGEVTDQEQFYSHALAKKN
jgi:CYTH domain-containing protein/predicted ATPase